MRQTNHVFFDCIHVLGTILLLEKIVEYLGLARVCIADRQARDTLADPETAFDGLPSRTAPYDDIIEMFGFDPRELNMLWFELDDDGI